MPIDMHSHWYPESLVEEFRARTELPYIQPKDDGIHILSYPGTDGSEFGAEWLLRAIKKARIEDWGKIAILDGTAEALLPGLKLAACTP